MDKKPRSEWTDQDFFDEEVRRTAQGIARKLRDTADRIERYAGNPLYQTGHSAHAGYVTAIMSEVRNLGGNLMLEQLATAAMAAMVHDAETRKAGA